MEFDPDNKIIRLSIQGMALEEQGKSDEASKVFMQAWEEATTDFEKFIAAHFVAKHQDNITDKLNWTERTLLLALKINDVSVWGALPSIYSNLAKCYEDAGDMHKAKVNYELASAANRHIDDKGPFYHGTKADLRIGDLLTPGGNSNYKPDVIMNHIYFTGLVNGAGLAAALAQGEGRERVYVVEPTGTFENDPNVTDKKFPGNPTRSYRSVFPLKIIGEVTEWARQTPEQIRAWQEKLANNKGEIIN